MMKCMNISIILIVVCYMLECEKILCVAYVECKENAELYLQGDKIVEVVRKGRTDMTIEACNTNSSVATAQFDPVQLFRNISKLQLTRVAWPFSHKCNAPERVYLYEVISYGPWSDCSAMAYLHIRNNVKSSLNLNMVSTNWLTNCTQLRSLVLREVSTAEVRKLTQSAQFVQNMTLGINDIHHIVHYPLFTCARNQYQQLNFLDIGAAAHLSKPSKSLENVSWPEVSASLIWQVSLLRLERLYISFNWFDFCTPGNFSSLKFPSLKYLLLENTKTRHLCFKTLRIAPQLAGIAIYQNSRLLAPGFKIQFSELFSAPFPQLLFDLKNYGQVLSFEFTREDYLALTDNPDMEPKRSKVGLVGFRQVIKCDCDGPALWLARSVRAGLVIAPGIMCEDYSKPEELACEWIDCDRISCNSVCVCCHEANDTVSADCRGTKSTSLPRSLLRLPNISRLVAPNNNIATLPKQLPDSLLMVDLSGNNIWHNTSESVVNALFAQAGRRVRIARNRILCSCDNEMLIKKLQDNSHQIEDFENITCAVTNTYLASVDISQLCASRDHDKVLIKNRETILTAVTVMLVAAAVSMIISVVVYKQRRKLQIFLFSRGWCLCCVTEQDLDADRCYDVFVSFCHADTTFVLTELLPSLDRDYSVCMHLRDWCPGEMIPSQITKSVNQSRRTLVVMSRNFVRSLWGRLEFQTAHVSGLADGRVRVVMIILDDVLEKDQLAPELRSYVRLNTYVRWGDPWFWEKLRYALPHHPSPRTPPLRLHIDCGPRETPNRHIEMKAIVRPETSESETRT